MQYTIVAATLACFYLIHPCIAMLHADVWSFNAYDDGFFTTNQKCWYDENYCGIDLATWGRPCRVNMSCVDIDMNDAVWTIEHSALQNMDGIEDISEFWFRFNIDYSEVESSSQCVASYKFDTQSTYQVINSNYFNHAMATLIPIDHNATTLYIKLETQGLAANDSGGCIWAGDLSKFVQDGQCEDDGDECIYIIGMDDGNAPDYVQKWHQYECSGSYPVYSRESNDSDPEYLCNNYFWYASDVNCSEIAADPGLGGAWYNQHSLGSCWSRADIFGCSGQGKYNMDFESDGDRYATKLITKCSEIDLSPVESEYNSSICLQLDRGWYRYMPQMTMYELSNTSDVSHYGTFSMSDRYSRSGKPLYLLKGRNDWMYYIHNDGNRWIVSIDTLTVDGIEQWRRIPRSALALFCDKDDLMDCKQGNWMQNGTVIDGIKVVAGECPFGGLTWPWEENVKEEKKKSVLPLIICGGIGGVALLLLLGIFCWRKQNKMDHTAVNADDGSVEIKVDQ